MCLHNNILLIIHLYFYFSHSLNPGLLVVIDYYGIFNLKDHSTSPIYAFTVLLTIYSQDWPFWTLNCRETHITVTHFISLFQLLLVVYSSYTQLKEQRSSHYRGRQPEIIRSELSFPDIIYNNSEILNADYLNVFTPLLSSFRQHLKFGNRAQYRKRLNQSTVEERDKNKSIRLFNSSLWV